ncbi:MAG: riboflavin synthase [Planctomycetes bacterium]|nr:riboflavin synthase [Planctomycetota bacterium]
MFTGIVQHVGTVDAVGHVDFGARIVIGTRGWTHVPKAGESIAVSGCCLTVCANEDAPDQAGRLAFDVIRQTLSVTALGDLAPGHEVNLEHAVTPETMLGGHVVQGHVDGVGIVRDVIRDETEWRVRVEAPADLMDQIVEKGSIAVDGVSLTLASVDDEAFEVALIPTTLERTTLSRAEPGTRVNLETDYIAKTVVNWLRRHGAAK